MSDTNRPISQQDALAALRAAQETRGFEMAKSGVSRDEIGDGPAGDMQRIGWDRFYNETHKKQASEMPVPPKREIGWGTRIALGVAGVFVFMFGVDRCSVYNKTNNPECRLNQITNEELAQAYFDEFNGDPSIDLNDLVGAVESNGRHCSLQLIHKRQQAMIDNYDSIMRELRR